MENHRIVAVDIGNSWFKSLISDQGALYEYQFPNAVALFDEEFYEEPYDEEDVLLEENIIVELNSPSITEKRQVYYAGKSALKMKNVSLTSIHNQKVTEDRTYTLLFAMMAYHAIQSNPGETELDFTVDQLAVSLPTTQYKTKKDLFKNKLLGTHRIVFHKVPGIDAPKEIAVKLHIEDVIIGAEGACAYLGLTRDQDTLLIKNESIAEASKKGIIIGDLGGDTVDFVGIKHGKPVASIEGEIFGINPFLDEIIRKVSKNELYTFDSRAELEEKLIQGPSEWYVEPFAGVRKDISRYIIPQLRLLAIRFLETFDRVRSSSQEIKGATMYIAVGGAASIAQKQIEEAAISWKKRGRPIELFFPEDMYKLNVLGLMILAKMNMLKKQQGNHEYVATARG